MDISKRTLSGSASHILRSGNWKRFATKSYTELKRLNSKLIGSGRSECAPESWARRVTARMQHYGVPCQGLPSCR